MKRFKVFRADILTIISNIDPKSSAFMSQVQDFYKTIYAITGIDFPNTEPTTILSPRQYACSRNAIYRIIEEDRAEAWWEIIDVITAEKTEVMSGNEMWMLHFLLEIFTTRFKENVVSDNPEEDPGKEKGRFMPMS